jgi:branched-chain amino acid transport system ATP-binding protein
VSALLSVEKLDAAYGDAQVLWDVDLTLEAGDIAALLGPNGAGKTTLLRTIAGLLQPTAGRIVWDGVAVVGVAAHESVARGIALVPEGRRLFAGMTVMENVRMGAYLRRERAGVQEDLEWIFDVFPQLAERRRMQAGSLSGGEQQMCAIARGLMARPRLLMLDELSLGLAPVIVDRIVEMLRRVHRERGTTMLVVEQDVQMALELASHAAILEVGRIVRRAEARELMDDPRVKTAYLGL